MHIAAQYLAAAAISFLDKEEDDSHTNLGFSITKLTLETRDLNENEDRLKLNYTNFSLEWGTSTKVKEAFSLDQKTHKEVLDWLKEIFEKNLFKKEYKYFFHYELPYAPLTLDFKFELTDKKEVNQLAQNRVLVHNTLAKFIEKNELSATIRIWPHHFDSGIFTVVNDTLSIGAGLAMPDTMIEDFYLYISGYNDQGALDPLTYPKLDIGIWKSEDWKGAVLPITNTTQNTALNFFEKSLKQYLTN